MIKPVQPQVRSHNGPVIAQKKHDRYHQYANMKSTGGDRKQPFLEWGRDFFFGNEVRSKLWMILRLVPAKHCLPIIPIFHDRLLGRAEFPRWIVTGMMNAAKEKEMELTACHFMTPHHVMRTCVNISCPPFQSFGRTSVHDFRRTHQSFGRTSPLHVYQTFGSDTW